MNWDPENKFKVEEDNLLNLRTGYPLYLQTTHLRPFLLERSNVGQCHELKFPICHHMSHLCGYWVMIWPIWGLGGAISLLYTYSRVCTWPSIVLSVQVFISLDLCLLPSKKLNFLGKFSGKDAILCRVSGPAAHNCPRRVTGFQVTTLGVFDQDSGFLGADRTEPKATHCQMVSAWVFGARHSASQSHFWLLFSQTFVAD